MVVVLPSPAGVGLMAVTRIEAEAGALTDKELEAVVGQYASSTGAVVSSANSWGDAFSR